MSLTTAAAVREVLDHALQTDDRVVLIGETVEGLAGTRRGLLEAYGPDRVIAVPISEHAAVGLATGLALAGKIPVVELSSTSRLPAVIEALAEAAAINLHTEFETTIVVRVPTGRQAGDRIDRPIAEVLRAIQGIRVVCPCGGDMLAGLLRNALNAHGPVVVLEPRELYTGRVVATDLMVPLSAARAIRSGEDITLATWGAGVDVCVQAAEELDREGITAAVLDMVSLAPLDADTLGRWVSATGRLVAVNPGHGWLAHSVLTHALANAFLYLEAPMTTCSAEREAVLQAVREAVYY